MPKLTIEGREIVVPDGTTVLEAARRLGFNIPTFCHHPGLTMAGNCRMCLVEVEKQPRLVSSCSFLAGEGMVVQINSPRVLEARRAVIGFLLANHPLDCPICDKAGECDLQDHAMAHGLLKSRFSPAKMKKPKVQDIGRHILLDSERCIVCARCVRFVNEVTETCELGIFGRGNRERLELAPGKRLDNPYSGNVVDLCPVGALTAKDFRFRCRAWFLEATESVCPLCARGCNVFIDTDGREHTGWEGQRILRVRPRENRLVNGHWMCDEGRFGFHSVDCDRVTRPLKRSGGKMEEIAWEDGMAECRKLMAAAIPSRAAILLSCASSLEDLFLARELARRCCAGWSVTADCPAGRMATQDDFLRMGDKFSNTAGAVLLGLHGGGPAWVQILEEAERGNLDTLIVVGHDLSQLYPLARLDIALHRVKHLIVLTRNFNDTVKRAGMGNLEGITGARRFSLSAGK
jgi:NADH-quinone oxidoreductase subunit G